MRTSTWEWFPQFFGGERWTYKNKCLKPPPTFRKSIFDIYTLQSLNGWFTYKSPIFEQKMIFQNYIFMFHVNLQGCSDQDDIFKFHQLLRKKSAPMMMMMMMMMMVMMMMVMMMMMMMMMIIMMMMMTMMMMMIPNRVDAQVVCQVGASTWLKHSVHDQVFIRWAHWSGCTLLSAVLTRHTPALHAHYQVKQYRYRVMKRVFTSWFPLHVTGYN